MKEVVFSKDELKYLRSKQIYIATPAYGEMVSAYYTRSIARVFAIASKYDIPVTYSVIGNESLITRARNEMTGSFLESDATHLMFIDADISFDPMDVFTLMLYKKDLIAAAYPTKGLAWDRVAKTKSKTSLDAMRSAINYVINFTPEQTATAKNNKGTIPVTLYGGLLEVYDAGTGFMLISREALETMIAAFKEDISYVSDSSTVNNDGTIERVQVERYALFDTSIDLETNRYLSEDYTFCRRWQNVGGQVWIDPNIILNHHGSYTYRGYPLVPTDANPST